MRYLLYSICLLSLFACSNAEEEKLRAAVKEELTVEATDKMKHEAMEALQTGNDIF